MAYQFYSYSDHSSDSAIRFLETPFSDIEVKMALFQMAPNKVPGPDEFSALFYQKCWHTVGHVVTQKILSMLNEGSMEEGINNTTIVLIPKVKYPSRLEEFRPISLFNVFGKIVSKILANRLKDILPKIIPDSQVHLSQVDLSMIIS